MKQELVSQLHSEFEQLVHTVVESGFEFWLAPDLQRVLGYDRRENFSKVIARAMTSCDTAGYNHADHFLEVTKMVQLGLGAER